MPTDPAQLAAAEQAIADRVTPHSPELAGVVSRLLADHDNHPLGLTGALLDPARRDRTVDLVVQLAQGTALAPYDGDLQAFLRDNPAAGPLFEPVADEANVDDAGDSRKQAAVEAGAEADPARAVGGNPTPEQEQLVWDYANRLGERVLPAVQAEIDSLAARVSAELGVDVHTSGRAKTAADLLNKVFRMMAGRPGAPGRPDATVGDVIDAVGVRMTLPDMASLEAALEIVTAHFGVGDGGRIVEIENMYAEPKAKAPAYRVITMTVSVTVDGLPYTFELQLNTERASAAADIEHNTVYKPYVELTDADSGAIRQALAEAAALDQAEAAGPPRPAGAPPPTGGPPPPAGGPPPPAGGQPHRHDAPDLMSRGSTRTNLDILDSVDCQPRTMETVEDAVRRAGIDLRGAEIYFVEDPEECRYLDFQDACACTPGELGGAQVRLGPASFVDAETLVATLQHESTHVAQLLSGRHIGTDNLNDLEDEAYASEAEALRRWRESFR